MIIGRCRAYYMSCSESFKIACMVIKIMIRKFLDIMLLTMTFRSLFEALCIRNDHEFLDKALPPPTTLNMFYFLLVLLNTMILASTVFAFSILALGMSLVPTQQHAEYPLTMQTALAQNHTNATDGCPYAHVMIDGACKLDEVRKYKFGTILLNMYDEYEASSKYNASGEGASGSSGTVGASSDELVDIVVAFEAYDCTLPNDLGIVDKGPCFTYHERASMGVLIPVSRLYDVASLDHVAGIYPGGEAVQLPFESPVVVYNEPSVDDLDVEEPSDTLMYENNYLYLILVSVAMMVIIATVMLYVVKKRGQIEV